MTTRDITREKGSDVQDDNQRAVADKDDPFAEDVVDERPEFRPSVDQEVNTKVETNHPETVVGREENEYGHLPLAQEEEIRAREEELERISAKAMFGQQEGREERTREVVVEARSEMRREWTERTVGWNEDPRPRLEQADLGAVNQQAARIAEELDGGPTRSLLSRRLAGAVACGTDITEAAFETLEWAKGQPGVIVPIEDVPDVDAPLGEVDVEGEIIALWTPSGSKVSQVGLIADETEKIKFTTWHSSEQPTVRVGDEVRIGNAEKDWWRGTCNLAVGWHAEITFEQEGARPAPELAEPSEPGGAVGPSPDVVSVVEQQSVSQVRPEESAVGSLFVNGELLTGRQVVETDVARLAVRTDQVPREPLVVADDESEGADLEDDERFESQTEECPSCEEEVEVSVEIQQLRSADEAGTRLYRGACGCAWREDD